MLAKPFNYFQTKAFTENPFADLELEHIKDVSLIPFQSHLNHFIYRGTRHRNHGHFPKKFIPQQ